MREAAVRAAVEVASRFGVNVKEPRVLRDSNNTIVYLVPAPVVAKVCTSVISRVDTQSAAREIRVALHARANGARVLSPSPLIPAIVHHAHDLAVTCWEYAEQVAPRNVTPAWFGAFVRELHDAMAGPLINIPNFSSTFIGARDLLNCREGGIEKLSERDLNILQDEFHSSPLSIQAADQDYRLVHGDCRPGNVMWTTRGPLWHDFEAVSYGPKEIDCSAMDDVDLVAYGPVDRKILGAVRQLQSVCVAIWCNAQKGRTAEVDEAAIYHLEQARLRHAQR